MQSITNNFIPFVKEALETAKQYKQHLFTDIISDIGSVIKEKTSDQQLIEIQIKMQFVRGSIVALITSLALEVIGFLLASPILTGAGHVLFFTGATVGIIALAGVAANNVIQTFHIKSTASLVK